MKISVVVCTYAEELVDHLYEAVESVLSGRHDDVEVVIVVDGNDSLHRRVLDEYADHDRVVIEANDRNLGLSASRNRGIEAASGDVIAFLDDDAVADERWLVELAATYEETDAIAAGGKMVGDWIAGNPSYLPPEFYWLVGVTQPRFAAPGEEVRNTFGSNISVRREALVELGGFDATVGRRGSLNLQAEEPVLGMALRERYGRGVVYNPDAVVRHKVFDYRTDPRWLLERAFFQGYSKYLLKKVTPASDDTTETAFLLGLFRTAIPSRIRALVGTPSSTPIVELCAIVLLTAAVGTGYLYGAIRWAVDSVRPGSGESV